MSIYAIDHVQLAIPPGEEERAQAFYMGVLGFKETPKPPLILRGDRRYHRKLQFPEGPPQGQLGMQELRLLLARYACDGESRIDLGSGACRHSGKSEYRQPSDGDSCTCAGQGSSVFR